MPEHNGSLANWQVLYYVATYVLAIVAVVGFIVSLRSSRKVSDTLKSMETGLSRFSLPLIKLVDYQWIVGNASEPLGPDNVPNGIVLTYKNLSPIPVQVDKSDFSLYYGDKELDEPGVEIGSPAEGSFILATGETISSGKQQNESFLKYLGKPKPVAQPPHLSVHLVIDFSTLDGKRFTYETKYEFPFNIAQPELKNLKPLFEKVTEK